MNKLFGAITMKAARFTADEIERVAYLTTKGYLPVAVDVASRVFHCFNDFHHIGFKISGVQKLVLYIKCRIVRGALTSFLISSQRELSCQ